MRAVLGIMFLGSPLPQVNKDPWGRGNQLAPSDKTVIATTLKVLTYYFRHDCDDGMLDGMLVDPSNHCKLQESGNISSSTRRQASKYLPKLLSLEIQPFFCTSSSTQVYKGLLLKRKYLLTYLFLTQSESASEGGAKREREREDPE